VITYELNLEASRYNLYYPPDPSSVKVSTIGGNIAHNAGGIKAVKYGVTKNFLLGMRAVTIDGKVLRLGGRVLKSVVGYDLMRLIAGSEGTLALITEATLRLIPKPESRSLFAVGLGDEYSWIDIVLNIYSSGILPCSIEFMDRVCLSVNQKLKEFESLSDRDIQSMLFIELDGNRDSVRRESEVIREILIKGNIKTFLFSDSPSEIERIWDIRRDVSPSLNLIGEFKIADDISIPLSNLRPLVSSLRDFAEKNNLTIAIFGHAGDSNLHINFLFKSRPAMEENYRLVMDHLSDIVIKYNGSISGEHGVGLLKREYAERELDRNAVELMKEIKRLMDPNNLLNPDKIFKSE
jgi:glycolate oxidase/D-lactate dehydrogenase